MPSNVAAKLVALLRGATNRWAKQRRAEDHHARARARRIDALTPKLRRITVKEAAFQVMRRAYLHASDNGRLPANVRQIMYAARPLVQDITGKAEFDDQYFTQTLLPDYINAHEEAKDWNVAYDDRGHFAEPHTDKRIGLGTLAVKGYLARMRGPKIEEAAIVSAHVSTFGPEGRYKGALFVEKEGFLPQLEAAQIAERFDVALMSIKGMSVAAARLLIDGLAAKGVRIYVLHDFDISGFSIAKTFVTSGRRHRFRNRLDVVDFGLRLADVEEIDLRSEPVAVGKNHDAVAATLRKHGATLAEVDFLLSGRRVELNALTAPAFVAFVERKLAAAGAKKVIPNERTLKSAYEAMARSAKARKAFEQELGLLKQEAIEVPADLKQRVEARLKEHPEENWDKAVAAIADSAGSEEDA